MSETKDLGNHIAIINQSDIYFINSASNLVLLSIPVIYFYSKDNKFFKCYFDRHLLQSSSFVKTIILQAIQHLIKGENQDEQSISKIIQTLLKEAVIRYKKNIFLKLQLIIQCLLKD